jgi:hypothetical protein
MDQATTNAAVQVVTVEQMGRKATVRAVLAARKLRCPLRGQP